MRIKDKMIEFMTKRNLNQVDLAKKSGVGQTLISGILTGKRPNPTVETIQKLAKAFNISVAELTGESIPDRPPIYIISYTDAGKDAHDYNDMGYPVWSGFDTVPRPADLKDMSAYALKVNGDSMKPMLKEGCIIVVSPETEVHNGDIAVVRDIQDNVKVKVITFKKDQIILGSFNPNYSPETFKKEEIKFIHKVVQIRF